MDWMVESVARHLDAQGAAADACGEIYARMRDEMTEALLHDPQRSLGTPGWRFAEQRASAAQIVADEFAGSRGDASLLQLLRIVAKAARAGDAEALAWIREQAEQYAGFHCEDEYRKNLE